ncbi:hypothetical protein Btru_076878 [Bulinus truncatus]|nr:hypothetical protein Btru_076878 [Bulinus truncatus]
MSRLHVILLVALNVLVALAQWDNGGNDDSSFGPGQNSFGPGQSNFGPGQQQFPPFWGGPQFPGSNPGFGSPFGGPGGPQFGGGRGFPQQPFQPFQPPQVLTCIGVNEALDHVKITLRPEPNSNFMAQNPAFQFGSARELQRRDWRISAVYIPAGSLGAISPSGTSSLVGQFFLAITRYGRTDGSCAGLGGILQNDDLLNNGQTPRGQPYSQFNNGMFGQTSYPAGFIQDPIVISQGGNVYSGVVRDLSEIDLRGRGVAICLDYLCQRPTTTCCSIVKDTAPATESVGPPSYVGPVSGTSIKGYTGGTGTAVATATAGAGTGTGGSSLFGGTSGGLF